MEFLTIVLFERLGLLLILAFILTRIRGFRSLLDRELNAKTTIVHTLIFGLFGIVGAMMGVVVEGEAVVNRSAVFSLGENELLVNTGLVAIVIAGLLGGPSVGLGAGIISGLFIFSLGGIGQWANGLANVLTGLLAGLTARFFSQERVIAPSRALFIGIFPPILNIGLLLVFVPHSEMMVALVDIIGLPMVLSNSVAIAIFTAMISTSLHEQEREVGLETSRALTIAEEALPYLKKQSSLEVAEGIAHLLYKRLEVAAVSVTDNIDVLAHIGKGDDHHRRGDQLLTRLSVQTIETGEVQVAYSQEEIKCSNPNCPLQAAIIVPIKEMGETTGLIKLYFRKAQHIRPVEIVLARGLGTLISNQLNALATEKMNTLIRDAELRNLQAQINPHFLFNTLHLIQMLIRTDPMKARHITVQLGHYMRFNLHLASNSLISLEKELAHVKAYLEIIRTRFSRLSFNIASVEGVGETPIPPATIQPLVENSIHHGLKHMPNDGVVSIVLHKQPKALQITVRDNGSGFAAEMLGQAGETPLASEHGSGTGLYNVNQRLIRLLGEESRLKANNLPTGGCEVVFQIPYQ
ncbi:histidine kinase [Salicibibacter cibarius]|uniref:histidine kinase n=1 Tax=Salicibibacter cibarius TaxID=2743000 RepID=A0A7T7CCD0_9BACI|nr:LytS/YhcK type 5TM receptor domain-containing protein [Salicibibacter cibarius]QQK76862.1 histidine kinase [Salicibibacter cibarius]